MHTNNKKFMKEMRQRSGKRIKKIKEKIYKKRKFKIEKYLHIIYSVSV